MKTAVVKGFIKRNWRDFLFFGFGWAIAMTIMDYFDNDPINPWKFVFYFVVFGLFRTIFMEMRRP